MDTVGKLTLEQEFNLKTMEAEINQMTPAQLKCYLLLILKQNMLKENLTKHLFKSI